MARTALSRRIALLKDELRKKRLDSFLVTKDVNVSYLSGFSGHDAIVIVTPARSFFITDSRYIEEAGDSVKGFEIRLARQSLYEGIKDIAAEYKLKRIGFESMDLPYEVANRLKSLVPRSELVPVKDLIEDLRAVKDPEEAKLIRGAIALTKDILERVGPFIKPGVTEEALARKIEIEFLSAGAKSSFDIIVAAGANSSKPHAAPTARKISKDSIVMLDIGCVLNSYNSDMTRMFVTGKIGPRMKKIYDIVRTAQAMAIEAIRPGVPIAKIDAVARQYIHKCGFGKYFGHALGHGVGLEVHEKPMISAVSQGVIKPGMVFTVEPAIYMPKFGGVRIEDMVLVTDKGCEILSK